VFDGEVFRPDQPLTLPAHRRYRLTVQDEPRPIAGARPPRGVSHPHPLSAIAALAVDMGMEDLSAGHDRYARGRLDSQDPASP